MISLEKIINDAEWKVKSLPEGYFLNYFKEDFLFALKKINKDYTQDINKLQKIIKLIYDKCDETSNSRSLTLFQNKIKEIIIGYIE